MVDGVESGRKIKEAKTRQLNSYIFGTQANIAMKFIEYVV